MDTINQPTEEEFEIMKKKGETYNEALAKVTEVLQPWKIMLEEQYMDIIKNIAIISGAIASFALTIFSSAITKIDNLLIPGVSLLLINVVIAFVHLDIRITKTNQNFKHTEDSMQPLHEFSDTWRKFACKQATFDDVKKIVEGLPLKLKDKIESPPPNPLKISHLDEVMIGILATAIVMIILSFTIPAIFKSEPDLKIMPQESLHQGIFTGHLYYK
jgi:hypothetical protein